MKKDVCETVVKDPAGGKTAHRGRDKTGVKAEEEAHVWSENPHRKHAASMAAGLGRRPRPGTDISTERQQGKAPGGPPRQPLLWVRPTGKLEGAFPSGGVGHVGDAAPVGLLVGDPLSPRPEGPAKEAWQTTPPSDAGLRTSPGGSATSHA